MLISYCILVAKYKTAYVKLLGFATACRMSRSFTDSIYYTQSVVRSGAVNETKHCTTTTRCISIRVMLSFKKKGHHLGKRSTCISRNFVKIPGNRLITPSKTVHSLTPNKVHIVQAWDGQHKNFQKLGA